ncbi:hypothetical protein Ddc_04721 [Ditylenchus destructor]|nr:hypothetical protein Ddc_04721 [Ditylenchus destructor]
MNSTTTAILLSVGISLAILLLCCVAIFIICYFSLCDDCCESKDDFGEQEITVEDVLLPRPDPEVFEKLRQGAPAQSTTRKLQPKSLPPSYFTKHYQGPIILHQWLPVETVKFEIHDLTNDVPPLELSKDKVTFSKTANEVYEFGTADMSEVHVQ